MDIEPSFSRLVFGKAISETIRFLGYKTRDIILAAITLILGFGIAYFMVGKAETVKEIATFAAFTLAPAGIVLFTVFAWNLWLAPAALAYETNRQALKAAGEPRHQQEAMRAGPDWLPWKLRNQYSFEQFAKILCKEDPAVQALSPRASGYLGTMVQDAKKGEIQYEPSKELAVLYGTGPSGAAIISKEQAMAWAVKKGIDVKHVI